MFGHVDLAIMPADKNRRVHPADPIPAGRSWQINAGRPFGSCLLQAVQHVGRRCSGISLRFVAPREVTPFDVNVVVAGGPGWRWTVNCNHVGGNPTVIIGRIGFKIIEFLKQRRRGTRGKQGPPAPYGQKKKHDDM